MTGLYSRSIRKGSCGKPRCLISQFHDQSAPSSIYQVPGDEDQFEFGENARNFYDFFQRENHVAWRYFSVERFRRRWIGIGTGLLGASPEEIELFDVPLVSPLVVPVPEMNFFLVRGKGYGMTLSQEII
mmetsp:Transcript_19045/g.39415  ORF Transcript_19045/g.39415 Transcript_19045/m.39415 type:complete len:129 (-) Transcript_19045:13-399(-)